MNVQASKGNYTVSSHRCLQLLLVGKLVRQGENVFKFGNASTINNPSSLSPIEGWDFETLQPILQPESMLLLKSTPLTFQHGKDILAWNGRHWDRSAWSLDFMNLQFIGTSIVVVLLNQGIDSCQMLYIPPFGVLLGSLEGKEFSSI
ncbi:hypothetical protein ACH5RR_029409 [Cinchona calisaya]|uniref:Uncharacterized protein n=1 Tax=Cinchona calisaya TaxID=153742 RepID=A0ABD2YSR7_9GENT